MQNFEIALHRGLSSLSDFIRQNKISLHKQIHLK